MEKFEYLILLILIIISIIINVFYNKSQKIYYFFDAKDEKSIELLNNILKNSNNEIILVTSEKDNVENQVSMRDVLQKLSNIRPVSKVLNIEKFSDLSEVVYESCFKNAKCIFQPYDRFYAIANKLNVQGYPFKFESKIDSPSNVPSDVNGNAAVNYGNSDKNLDLLNDKNASVTKIKEFVEGPGGCNNTRSSRGLGE